MRFRYSFCKNQHRVTGCIKYGLGGVITAFGTKCEILDSNYRITLSNYFIVPLDESIERIIEISRELVGRKFHLFTLFCINETDYRTILDGAGRNLHLLGDVSAQFVRQAIHYRQMF